MFGFSVQRRRRLVEHQHKRSVTHEAPGQRQLLPLAEAQLYTLRPGHAELRMETRGELSHQIFSPGAVNSREDRRLVFQPGHIADTDGVAGTKLETEEVLES